MDGREHFEDGNFEDITLTASLYYGKDAFSEGITYQWYKLSEPNKPFPSEEKSTSSTITVSRSDIISEDRFKCIITHEKTGIEYYPTFDIWDKTDEYDCIILSNDPLLLSEDDKTITLSVNVFNKNGELINGEDPLADLSYEWRIGESEKVLKTKVITLSSNDDDVPKKQSFPIFCKVFLGQEEENRRLITQEIETIQFIPAFTAKVTPPEIFIPVDSDGNHLGSNWNYNFTFSLLDKAGNVMPFITDDKNVERGPINGNNVTFTQQASLWEFNGTINVENNWELDWTENTKFLEFTYVYCGKTFTFGIMLIKNVKGDSNYNAFITSSSGSTLMNGDNETQLEAFLYYGKQILEDNLFYEWIASGISKELGNDSTTKIMASDFKEKTNVTCKIYLGTKENHAEEPLASPSYTLINLTQALPVSLILESNYAQHIQTKLGNFYEPNFNNSTPLKIEPTLKVGQTEVSFSTLNTENSPYRGKLKYEIESSDFETIIIYKGEQNDGDLGFSVDNQGILSCSKNLPANITIEAYIEDFTIQGVNYGTIQAMNPINFLLLEQGKDTAIATITSTREYFDDKNATEIELTASLAGSNSTDLSYSWTKVLNSNSIIKNDKAQSITIQRSDILNQEIYSCEITNNITGLTYSASKIIYDFTDEYFCEISYDKPLLLTEENTQVKLSVNVWDKYGNEVNTETTKLSYVWDTIPDKNSGAPISTEKEFILSTNNASIPQKQTFTVYCRVYLNDNGKNPRQISSDSVTFQYTSEYQAKVTPSTIFIPTTSGGDYNDNGNTTTPKTYSFNFKLLGADGNPISFTNTPGNETRPDDQNSPDGTTISFDGPISGKWNFNATITFNPEHSDYLWSDGNRSVGARAYEFTYVYMGQTFTEEINIIKSYAGKEGQSFSGYTVDLSNSFHAFKGGEISADPNQNPVECIVTAYYGDEPCDIEEIRLNSTSGSLIYSSSSNYSEVNRNNLFISATGNVVGQEEAVKLSFTPGKSGKLLTEVAPVNLYVKILPPGGISRTIVKTFSYVINYGGRSYYLDFNGNNTITYNKSGTYTPSSLTVQALYRDTTSAPTTYSNGIIIYRKNSSGNWILISRNGSGTISDYSNLQNLQIRLYKSTAFDGKAVNTTISSTEIDSNANYLLDSEVIPVLTSMEGYEIGGDNLIKWSKTFSSLDSNRWTIDSNVSIQSSLDFFEAVWSGTGSIYSPLIEYSSAYSNKDFCLSFDI